MIESPIGVTHAADIASVPGLDGIMIGTADLRAASTTADLDPVEAVRHGRRGTGARAHSLAGASRNPLLPPGFGSSATGFLEGLR
jgi:citrate lyase beta subunit